MHSLKRSGAFAGLLASLSMVATPAAAVEIPVAPVADVSAVYADFDHSAYDGEAEIAQNHRYYGYGYPRYRRNRVDAGDVITGVLILGGIAAIANAANKNDRRYRDRDYRVRGEDYRNYRDNDRRYADSGIDNAVDRCVARIERDERVRSVDRADRNASGWIVEGALENGASFTCRIGNDGRISDVDFGGYRDSSYGDDDARYDDNYVRADDDQWSDDRYLNARRSIGMQEPDSATATATVTDEPMPAYPGGPLPGEEYPDDDLGG